MRLRCTPKLLATTFSMTAVLLLVACGGGGGNSGTVDTVQSDSLVETVQPDSGAVDLDSVGVDQSVSTSINVLAAHSGLVETPFIVTITSPPSHGNASVDEDGRLIYVSDSDYLGTDTLSFQITDGEGNVVVDSVSIIVGCSLPPCDRAFQASWDPLTHPDVVGYCLHHGVQPGPPYDDTRCVGANTTSTEWSLPVSTGTDYFVVTALGFGGTESEYSGEVSVSSF